MFKRSVSSVFEDEGLLFARYNMKTLLPRQGKLAGLPLEFRLVMSRAAASVSPFVLVVHR
jgi:hypothetical protein